jgi:hypothetical protein
VNHWTEYVPAPHTGYDGSLHVFDQVVGLEAVNISNRRDALVLPNMLLDSSEAFISSQASFLHIHKRSVYN